MSEPIPPPESKRRDFRNFISSVRYALDGFWAALKHEPSFREDLIFVIILTPFAIILPVNAVSTAVMIFSLFLIVIAELLNSAVEVLDRFIADGVLVSTKGRTTDQNSIYEAKAKGTWNVPLVLLTDGDSASASEIVAGAVRDHHRATIVGRKTYGKWSVQSILPGQADSGFRLTTAKFYAPNGETFGKVGIKPDITIPEDKTQASAKRGRRKDSLDDDRDVEAGLEVLRKQMAKR